MKLSKLILIAALSTAFVSAYALETEDEKKEATKKELSRDTDKAVNRVKEAVCMDTDTECLKEKAKHRLEETTDAVKDKAGEVKNKVDE
ncbi:MAG: hypothetical protein ABL933_02180 [Methyloglobulus sp.]|nr:hypothetical protein [Methyloglobulus sp.]